MNSSYVDNTIDLHPRVNVGIAIAVDDGLVVPTVYDADTLGVDAIGAAVRDLAARAKHRKLSREVLADSTFTVSNLGMFGIEDFDPLINPPHAAILGVGAATADHERPAAHGADARLRPPRADRRRGRAVPGCRQGRPRARRRAFRLIVWRISTVASQPRTR